MRFQMSFIVFCLLFVCQLSSFGRVINITADREPLSVVFHEGFDDASFPPTGWSVTNLGVSEYGWEHIDWMFYQGSGAVYSNWDIDEVHTWLITPAIALEADIQYHLEFYQRNFNMNLGGNSVVMLSTGSNQAGSGDFVQIYEMTEAFPEFSETVIDLNEFAGHDIYLAFVHQGANAHEWVVDEVKVREISSYDAGVTALISPSLLVEPGFHEVIVEIRNFGSNPITTMYIVCEINDLAEIFPWEGLLNPGETTQVSVINSFDFSSPGIYSLTATTMLENDNNPSNDSFATEILSGESCGYIVYMTNWLGSGFQGAVIGVVQSGVLTASFGPEFTQGEQFGPITLPLAHDHPSEIVAIHAGDTPSALGFTLISPQGDTIHHRSFGSSFSAGEVFEVFHSDCSLLDYDAGIFTFSMETLFVGEEISAQAQVINYGSNAASFVVNLEVRDADNMVVEAQDIALTDMETGSMETIVFDEFTLMPGNYTAVVSIVWDLDENPANDQMARNFDTFDGILVHYDDGVNNDLIGWSVQVWDAAILFEPADRFLYGNGEITHLRVYVGQAPTSMEVKIWQGPGAETEIYSQAFEPTAFSWNIVSLDMPKSIDPELDLYVGVRVYGAPFVMAVGVDAQLNHPGYGNLFRPDGIGPWYESGEKDWNLQFVFMPVEPHYTVTFIVHDADDVPIEDALVSLAGYGSQATVNGYAVFEEVVATPAPGIPYTISADGYIDIDGSVIVEDDTIVEISLITVGAKDNRHTAFGVYPNPSKGNFRIETGSERIHTVRIYNRNGMLVHTSTSGFLDVSDLPGGLYFLKVFTDKGIYHERLVLQ